MEKTPNLQERMDGLGHTIRKAQQETDEHKAKEAERNKALAPYSDNLPYDRNRIIEETKFLLKHEIVSKYEIGKRLILLQEREIGKTFSHILEEHFPGLSYRYAHKYMLFTRKIAALPKLKEFAEGGNNWTKALALIESFDEEELAALEAGGSIADMTLDAIDKMSYRELKIALRNNKTHIKHLEGSNEELETENVQLNRKLRKKPDEPEAVKVRRAEKRWYDDYQEVDQLITKAVVTLNRMPEEAIQEDFDLQVKVTNALNILERMVGNLTLKINRDLSSENYEA